MTFLRGKSQDRIDAARRLLEEGWASEGNCKLWNGPLNSGGYGQLFGEGVHRWSYALNIADFKKGGFICHRCNNPRCYNSDHLYLGDAKTNAQDAMVYRCHSRLYPK